MTSDTTFAADDWRSKSDLFAGEAFRRNLAVVRDLTAFAARRDATVAQLAIAWTLANPAVDVAIVGARSAEQIRQTTPGADLRLTAEDLAADRADAARRGRRRRPGTRSDAEELTHTSVHGKEHRHDRNHASPSRVAILGTGKMGSAIAGRLDEAGFELVLWNRTRSRAEALGLGTVADTPAAAVAGADVVVSSLTGPDAVLATYLGPDGALTAGAGKHFVEMSTAGPDLVSDLAAHVAAAGGTLVDAPILGAPTVRPRGRGRHPRRWRRRGRRRRPARC